MYNNPYFNSNYTIQSNIERINSQIGELQKIKEQIAQQQNQQMQQPAPNVTQNFQLAPATRETIKYANSIDEVQKDLVIGDTPYFSKDLSIVWIKNIKGDIKTYELNEIIPKDSKDIQIEYLQSQIEELKKGMIKNEQSYTNANTTEVSTNTSEDDETTGNAVKKNKPSSISRVSSSKKG